MLMTVEEARQYIDNEMADETLEAMLEAIEDRIQAHTNNEFVNGYNMDIKLGAIGMLKYTLAEMENSKAGISSESIARHSVTYKDGGTYIAGYPPEILGFLTPYIKARF